MHRLRNTSGRSPHYHEYQLTWLKVSGPKQAKNANTEKKPDPIEGTPTP